jgi:hypothetical protein
MMLRIFGPLTRRLLLPPQPPVSPTRAPDALRQRVLASVRGDAKRLESPRQIARRHHMPAGLPLGFSLGLLVTAALGVTAVFAIVSKYPLRGHAPRAPGTRAHLRRLGARAELIVAGMREPPPGQVYELWIERPGQAPQPTDALFTVTSAGDGTVEVPGGLRGVSDVMVTREPRGGSSTPTSQAVLRVLVHRLS